MAFPFLAAAISLVAVSTAASVIATEEQVKAAKKENRVRRRVASVERAKKARQRIAQRRVQEAEVIQSSEAQGNRSNSAVSGFVGGLRSDTAGAIGLDSTQFAGDVLANRTRLRGIRRAGTFGTIANVANTASDLFLLGNRFSTPVASQPKTT